MTKRAALEELINSSVSRRAFAKSLVAAGGGLAASGMMPGVTPPANGQSITDTDILNFALNLEYFEAEFYTVITSGTTIDQPPFNIPITGAGTPGPTTGAGQLNLSSDAALNFTALELAFDERAHVQVLRSALGSAAIAKPAINFAPAGVTSITRFLQVARILEDIGVTAYGGAAPLITSKAILATAARIALAEGIHTGNIRLHHAQRGITSLGPVDAVDILVQLPPNIGRRLISVDAQGLTAVRTPSQVLSIVYGPGAPSGTDRGLFFPNGFNGTIRTV